MLNLGNTNTFQEYAYNVFVPAVDVQACKSKKVDIVFDTTGKTA